MLLVLAPASRAELKFTPVVNLRESYTDNVNLTSAAQAQSQWLTDLSPGFELSDNNQRVQLRATYRQHLFYTPNHDIPNTQHSQAQALLDGRAAVIQDLFYFDAYGAISQQAVSAFGPPVLDNGYTTNNRTRLKTFRVSPSLRHNFGSFAQTEVRYTRDSVSSDQNGLGNSSSNSLSASVAGGPAFHALNWGLQYFRQVVHDSITPNSSMQTTSGNVKYALSQTFSLTGNGGYDKNEYQSVGDATAGKFWTGGFNWEPSGRSSLAASMGRHYFGKTFNLKASHRSRGTVWSLNYDDSISTTRSNFLLPATIDTAALVDRMLAATIPDPIQRALAVQAYLHATGLPPSLADSVNYLSNRYFRQKQFQAAVAYKANHSTVMFSLVDTRRLGLSAFESDSLLLGSSNGTLNDNTHQIGASVQWNLQLTARTAFNASLTNTHIDSIDTGISSRNTAVSLMLNQQIGARLTGALEVRHVMGSSGLSVGNYKENGVAASLNLQL